MQAEEVGLSKTVMVGNKFSITAGDELEIKVGESRFSMKADGTIELRGKKILIAGETLIDLDAGRIDLN